MMTHMKTCPSSDSNLLALGDHQTVRSPELSLTEKHRFVDDELTNCFGFQHPPVSTFKMDMDSNDALEQQEQNRGKAVPKKKIIQKNLKTKGDASGLLKASQPVALKHVVQNCFPSKNQSQNNHINYGQLGVISKTGSKKRLVKIYDWIMEMASLLRMSKTVFYLAVMIFAKTSFRNCSIMKSQSVQGFACASLLIAAKLQSGTVNFLEQIYRANRSLIPKNQILKAEVAIYEILDWDIPIMRHIAEDLIDLTSKWNDFVSSQVEEGLLSAEFRERLMLYDFTEQKYQSFNSLSKKKLFTEVSHLTDLIVLHQTKRYLISQRSQFAGLHFEEPILIALYGALTISIGDHGNREGLLFPLFHEFISQHLEWSQEQAQEFKKNCSTFFQCFDFPTALSKVPLLLNCQDKLSTNSLHYISLTSPSKLAR